MNATSEIDELLDNMPPHLRNKILEHMPEDHPPKKRRLRNFALRSLYIFGQVLVVIGHAMVWVGMSLREYAKARTNA